MESRYIKTLTTVNVALLVAAALLASSEIGVASSPPDSSFVGATPETVAFLQWTESSGGSMTGQMQIASVTPASRGPLADLLSWLGFNTRTSSRLRVNTYNVPFIGVRNGQSVSITFSQLFVTKTLTGSLKGNTLTLTVPRSDGLLSTFEMRGGAVDDYNRSLITLQKRVAEVNALLDQRAAVLRAAKTLQDVHSRLPDDLALLERRTNFAEVLEDYEQTWIKMQQDEATLRTDAAKAPLNCTQLSHVRYVDLAALEYSDMSAITYRHNVAFNNIRDGVLEAVDAARKDVGTMTQTLVELQRAVKADTTKTLSQTNIDQLTQRTQLGQRAAEEQVRSAIATLQQAETEARTYNEKASELLNAAKQYVDSLSCTGW
jgi:hypothetical protein